MIQLSTFQICSEVVYYYYYHIIYKLLIVILLLVTNRREIWSNQTISLTDLSKSLLWHFLSSPSTVYLTNNNIIMVLPVVLRFLTLSSCLRDSHSCSNSNLDNPTLNYMPWLSSVLLSYLLGWPMINCRERHSAQVHVCTSENLQKKHQPLVLMIQPKPPNTNVGLMQSVVCIAVSLLASCLHTKVNWPCSHAKC